MRGPEGREEVLGHVRKVQTGMREPPVAQSHPVCLDLALIPAPDQPERPSRIM